MASAETNIGRCFVAWGIHDVGDLSPCDADISERTVAHLRKLGNGLLSPALCDELVPQVVKRLDQEIRHGDFSFSDE